MSLKPLSATGHALLGLLALRSWTTYELCVQMRRSLHQFWPRAESNLYAAAQALLQRRLATTTATQSRGCPPGTTYRISQRGEALLADWVRTPGKAPVLECEALVKVFFSEHSSKAALLDQLRVLRRWADDTEATNRQVAREYQRGKGPFPQRIPVIMLTSRLLWTYVDAWRSWAAWAEEEVRSWPEAPEDWPSDAAMVGRALGPFLDRLDADQSGPGPTRRAPRPNREGAEPWSRSF